MNISQIIAVVGFLAIVIIIIALLLKKFREERAEEKKERKLRGESSEEEKDEKKVSRGSKPLLNFFKNIQSILLPMCIYITILISFSILLPDLWGKYWGDKEFFWVSQVYIVAMIAIRRLDVASIRFVLRGAFSVIIALYLYGKMPETTKEMPKTSGASLTQGEVYGNRLATIGPEWSQKFVIPKEGGTLRIKRVDPSIPLECLVTLIDDSKKIFKIPGVEEGYGDFNLPDSEGLRIRTTYPTTTTVWIIIKPL